MKTEKDLIMFYHSGLRNVGLFTSISLAMLGYSRFYRGKNRFYNISFIVISLALMMVAIYLSNSLVNDINDVRTNEMLMIKKWIPIPHILIVINSIVTLFGLFTLYKELTKK